MATSETTVKFLLDQLGALPGVRVSKMFGEYALYYDEKVVALICDDQLFLKITAPGKALVGDRYAHGFAYPGAKASILVGADELDDHDRLTELIRVTAAALPPPKPPKASKPKPTKPRTTDELLARLQTPKARQAARAAFDASPAELGAAAAKAARKPG